LAEGLCWLWMKQACAPQCQLQLAERICGCPNPMDKESDRDVVQVNLPNKLRLIGLNGAATAGTTGSG
jgi:hypothetical protein